MREIALLEPDADRTHDAGGDPAFQESSLIVWHDVARGIGGVWRISQEPVNGLTHSCFGVFAPGGARFRHNVQNVPFAQGDRGSDRMGMGSQLRLDLARMAITVDLPDCSASLVFEDFHPRWDYLDLLKLKMPEGHGGKHLEVAGRVTGRLRIGDEEFEIDALGHRDRSWGPRNWTTLLATRWWPIVFGPDLCVHMQAMVHGNGESGCSGYLVRDGMPILMTQADIGVTLDLDSVGPRAAHTVFTLETGETGEIVHRRRSGVVLDVKGFLAVESIGTAVWGDRTGMSNIEVCSNPFGGVKAPAVILEADHAQGLSFRRV